MRHSYWSTAGRWLLMTLVLAGTLLVVPEATAQRRSTTGKTEAEQRDDRSSRRGRSARSSAEKKKGKATRRSSRTERSARSGRTERSSRAGRSSSREQTRSNTTRQRHETRQSRERTRDQRARDQRSRGDVRTSESSRRRAQERSQRGTRHEGRDRRDRERRDDRYRDQDRRDRRDDRVRDRHRDQRRDHRVRDRHRDRHRDGHVRHHRPRYQRPVYRHHHKRYRRYKRHLLDRPYVHIDLDWPWEHRYRTGWKPRYRHRQVVVINVGQGPRARRSHVEVQTDYYHRIVRADRRRAVVDLYIDRITLYDRGRFIGEVDRVPQSLGRIRATIHRDGYIEYDRDVFLVGDPYVGFELIQTRHYRDYVLGAYHRDHGYRAGVLDLRRGRVETVRRSRLFDPYGYVEYAPLSLLPEQDGWLLDYGRQSFSGAYYERDPLYYGGYYNDEYYEDDYYDYGAGGDAGYYGVQPLTRTDRDRYATRDGAAVVFQRESQFIRVE